MVTDADQQSCDEEQFCVSSRDLTPTWAVGLFESGGEFVEREAGLEYAHFLRLHDESVGLLRGFSLEQGAAQLRVDDFLEGLAGGAAGGAKHCGDVVVER